jgi:hypothetical protein
MTDMQQVRASDRDRQEVVDRLRGAVEDGRLKVDEYMDRMGLAYQAATYGDLAPLYSDLPAGGSLARQEATPLAPAPLAVAGRRDLLAGLPAVLKLLWAIWLTTVSVNVVVWVLVSGTTGHLIYPWPLWVAGPYGAGLFAVSAGVALVRRSRPAATGRMPPGNS